MFWLCPSPFRAEPAPSWSLVTQQHPVTGQGPDSCGAPRPAPSSSTPALFDPMTPRTGALGPGRKPPAPTESRASLRGPTDLGLPVRGAVRRCQATGPCRGHICPVSPVRVSVSMCHPMCQYPCATCTTCHPSICHPIKCHPPSATPPRVSPPCAPSTKSQLSCACSQLP